MYKKTIHISIVYTNIKWKIIIIAMPHFIADLRDGPNLKNFMTIQADEMVQLNRNWSQSFILFATTKQ
jgi:hypothetical protein